VYNFFKFQCFVNNSFNNLEHISFRKQKDSFFMRKTELQAICAYENDKVMSMLVEKMQQAIIFKYQIDKYAQIS
jgi:hypothetical protein